MVMGRGSDTRLYNPRSESDKMYSSANEDETKYNPASPEYNEQKREEKKRKEEEKKANRSKIKHIKIRASQGLRGEESPVAMDDSNKRDEEREIGLTGGPPGSRGNLLDLATGAKTGTGSAMTGPLPIAMSEPMEDAWSTLLKASLEDLIQERDKLLQSGLKQEAKQFDYVIQQMLQPQQKQQRILQNIATPTARMLMPDLDGADLQRLATEMMYEGKQNPDYIEMQRRIGNYDPEMKQQFMRNVSRMSRLMPKIQQQQEKAQQSLRDLQMKDPSSFFADEEIMTSEPMEDAWSSLLKAWWLLKTDNYRQAAGAIIRDSQGKVLLMRRSPLETSMHGMYELPGGKLEEGERPEDAARIEALEETGLPIVNLQALDPHIDHNMQKIYHGFTADIDPQHKGDVVRSEEHDNHMWIDPQEALDMEGHPDGMDVPFLSHHAEHLFQQIVGNEEPITKAWSDLLKRETPRTIARRRKQEARQEFRPSTGQFKRPPGGMDPVGATMRRFKARMRGIKGGKKTGLMKPHLAVEMSHRGIATKQPMSKDPQRYRAYQGQSEARKILGNVRTTFSPHARYAQRSSYAGPTGAGRLGGLLPQQKGMMRQPSLRPLRVKAPRPPRPPMMPPMMPPQLPPVQSSVPSMPAPPSSIMMSEDRTQSDILKARNFARRMELLNLMRRLIAAKEREAKLKKAMQGGGSAFENGHVPDHPAGVQNNEDEDEKNDGPTQNLETNSSRMGLDPAGVLISRRGHMG